MLADEVDALQPEVRDWEPQARASSATSQTEQLAARSARRARPGGALVLEAHEDHAAAGARRCSSELGYAGATITRDLAGRERVVEATVGAET